MPVGVPSAVGRRASCPLLLRSPALGVAYRTLMRLFQILAHYFSSQGSPGPLIGVHSQPTHRLFMGSLRIVVARGAEALE